MSGLEVRGSRFEARQRSGQAMVEYLLLAVAVLLVIGAVLGSPVDGPIRVAMDRFMGRINQELQSTGGTADAFLPSR